MISEREADKLKRMNKDELVARVIELQAACEKALAFHDRYCDRVGPADAWARSWRSARQRAGAGVRLVL